MERYLWCAETTKGIYHGAVRAANEASARRLLASYLDYGEYGALEQLDLHRVEAREDVQVHCFNKYETT